MKIHPEQSSDIAAIDVLLKEAFTGTQEADLVRALRNANDLIQTLVAKEEDNLIGYVALSQMIEPPCALALAPLAVKPACQRQGIGTALIREAIRLAKNANHDIIFVVGDPNYYEPFGFSLTAAQSFQCKYAGPYFMALRLKNKQPVSNNAIYPNAFEAL